MRMRGHHLLHASVSLPFPLVSLPPRLSLKKQTHAQQLWKEILTIVLKLET